MNKNIFSTLAVGSLAAAGLLASTGVANAGIIKTTTPQAISFGPAQTDYTEPFTFDQFDPATDVVLDPGETFGSFNSVHITLSGVGVSGPGTVICTSPDVLGRCQGTVSSNLTLTLGLPTIPEIATLVIPLIQTPLAYDLGLNEIFTIPEITNSDSISVTYDLKQLLPTGTPEAEIQAILDAFEGNGIVDVLANADGEFEFDETTGSAISGNPITAEVTASIFYDYHVETAPPPRGVPEPSTLIGLGLFGGLGLLAKRKQP